MVIIVEDAHMVGKKVKCEALEVEEMVMEVGATRN